ncbi:Mast/stem cell growth factor receptor kita [Mytilus coruscus]|uniref:Mast/stem cell growth factor receptor kita n=1 Tax=Mytilus coruscus TaxID=42192 RepID=A0A6J8CZH3_MYTCO|nr:Mast/stem cell growth factor receptor kita [Mytilus coruscus]
MLRCCAWKTVWVSYYRYENFCCNGWTTSSYQRCNKAICRPNCGNGGQCTLPNVCSCPDGFAGDRCYGAAACSHTSPCYPGDCQGSSGFGSCVCSTEFSGDTCLKVEEVSFKPRINRCNATFTFHVYDSNMDKYSYFGDATELDEPYILWSNQRDFNILDMTMEVQYDTDYDGTQTLPDYVSSMELGIISAKVETEHFKLGSGGVYSRENNETYTCNGPTRNKPISKEILECKMNGKNNIRVDSADRFVLTFSATAGGFRRLRNRDTDTIYPHQYYSEKTTSSIIEFRFDYDSPIHCTEESPPCSNSNPLHMSEDITKTSFSPRWDGWKDELSGVMRYSLEVWKMEYSKDFKNLREPLITTTKNPIPVFIREVNVTDPFQYPTFPPTEPGVYSCILEVSDNANNTRYARRFVLYDRTSEITTQNENPMKCTTASSSTGYIWQTNGDKTVQITWKDHFINTVHADGHFLSPISAYEPRLTDGGRRIDYKKIENKFDDHEGKMNRNGTDNINGIVKFEFAYQSPSADVSNLKWTDLDLSENRTLTLPSSDDGFSQKFWVRASDIIGNTKEDTTVVYFDGSRPSIGVPTMDYNLKNGRFDFSSRQVFLIFGGLSFVSKDDHSGVPLVKLKIVTHSGEVKYEHRYSDADLIVIISVTELSGIQEYYGVTNLQVPILKEDSFEITWEQPKSCYERLGIKLMVTNEEGHSQEHKVFKDATSYTVGNLNASATYIIHMFTKYGTDEYFEMSDAVNATITLIKKPGYLIGKYLRRYDTLTFHLIFTEPGGIAAGAIAGIIVGFLLLILIFIVILIFLHRTGRLTKAKEQVNTGFTKIRNTIKLRDPESKSGYNNRAYSGVNEDEYYIEGGIQISTSIAPLSRKSISLESEITRGRFAIIYKAIYYGNNRDAETVVAKTLKDQANDDDLRKMRTKINFYATKVGHHKHVLDFKGFVEDDVRGPFMVLEFCENGSLKDYLRENKSRVNDDMTERLYRISYGTCMGMDYLASNGIVHRRLAARNILLNFLLEPKITGFGPDPDADKDNDDSSERIPVKWMAPECMSSTKKATEKSDVWSYGIVLWEIFSMGETPYPDIKGPRLPDWLRQNNRMAKPEYCDDTFYKMMKKCWQYDPNKRPNFKKLNTDLAKMFSEGPDEEYYYRSSRIYDNRT